MLNRLLIYLTTAFVM